MAQFVAIDPNVETNGTTILSVVDGMGAEILPVLEAHGLVNLDPGDWVPQQQFLDTFREIAEGEYNAMFNLVAIGMKIPDNAVFPPEIDSIVSALHSIDVAYHMNHRNGEIGHYHCQVIGEKQIDLICENPYPCDFDYGIIYSMARRFRPTGSKFLVRHDDQAPCRKKGGDSCTYHVTWE
jgi:hypothetical protein